MKLNEQKLHWKPFPERERERMSKKKKRIKYRADHRSSQSIEYHANHSHKRFKIDFHLGSIMCPRFRFDITKCHDDYKDYQFHT